MGCAALLLWPVVVFGPHLKFDPAHFVEIWLHVASEALIVVFVVESVQDRRREHDSMLTVADLLDEHILNDLTQARSALLGISRLVPRVTEQDAVRLQTAIEHLSALTLPLQLTLQLIQRSQLNVDGERVLRQVAAERWVRTLRDLLLEQHWADADLTDFTTLLREVDKSQENVSALAARCRTTP